jgi:hypothetical protein
MRYIPMVLILERTLVGLAVRPAGSCTCKIALGPVI